MPRCLPPIPDLTPAWLPLALLNTLQPRIEFGQLQRHLHAKPDVSRAIEQMLRPAHQCAAYTALLRHLSEDDFNRYRTCVRAPTRFASAATLSLHEAQLQDLWVLRKSDASVARLFACCCTPASSNFRCSTVSCR